jgi:DNA-binding response OmpR family regulator
LTDRRARVLVADDDAVILRLLEVNFSLEGFDVVTADRGEEALRKATSDGPFDLILLDVMMPGMDGWTVAEALKSEDRVAGVPIVFLSARTQEQDRARGLSLGVAAYVTKPFDPDELLGLARRLIDEGESAGSQA